MEKYFAESELMINPDGSCYHLHLRPDQLADKVILCGDPERVSLVASHFRDIICDVHNREFRCVTGYYNQKLITVVGTGIGCDNIDIVLNELDALANIDFKTRKEKETFRQLTFVRIGTCGGLQTDLHTGSFVATVESIGFDGLLNFYAGRDKACDLECEKAFKDFVHWDLKMGNPYVAPCDEELLERIAGNELHRGITIACGGFYGPQGRELRLPLADPKLNEKIEAFEYKGLKITNFEMESSAVAGLSKLMGHKALTCCMVIANRRAHKANTNVKGSIDKLIQLVLDRI